MSRVKLEAFYAAGFKSERDWACQPASGYFLHAMYLVVKLTKMQLERQWTNQARYEKLNEEEEHILDFFFFPGAMCSAFQHLSAAIAFQLVYDAWCYSVEYDTEAKRKDPNARTCYTTDFILEQNIVNWPRVRHILASYRGSIVTEAVNQWFEECVPPSRDENPATKRIYELHELSVMQQRTMPKPIINGGYSNRLPLGSERPMERVEFYHPFLPQSGRVGGGNG